MNAAASALDARIAGFAAAVRSELSDLPADDVDDLVDGLDADLAEQASESDDFTLPDPVAYAAELRSAAGLPERPTDAPPTGPPFGSRVVGSFAELGRGIRSSRAGAWLVDLFVALRPVWWIARGWALYALVAVPLGMASDVVGFPWTNTGGWLLLGVLILLSIQWGRGRWAPLGWLRVARMIVSVVTAVALPFLVTAAVASVQNLVYSTHYVETYVEGVTPGLSLDGNRVRNVYAYDAEGNPLIDVQLFDQDGRPLVTVGAEGTRDDWSTDYFFDGGGGPVPVPLTAPGREAMWNVYPLSEVPAGESSSGLPADPSGAVAPDFPFERITPVPDTSTSGPAPTPTPTDGVTPQGDQVVTSESTATGAEG